MKNNDDALYESYERMMVEYAKVSDLQKKCSNISLAKLHKESMELKKVNDEFIGYVTITNSGTNKTYKAYINCGERYQTQSFNANILNSTDTVCIKVG